MRWAVLLPTPGKQVRLSINSASKGLYFLIVLQHNWKPDKALVINEAAIHKMLCGYFIYLVLTDTIQDPILSVNLLHRCIQSDKTYTLTRLLLWQSLRLSLAVKPV